MGVTAFNNGFKSSTLNQVSSNHFAAIVSSITHLKALIVDRMVQRRVRSELHSLSPRMLADIGISISDIDNVVSTKERRSLKS